MNKSKMVRLAAVQLLARSSAVLAAFAATSSLAQVPSNPADYIRTKAYTYNADGTVQTQTVEPTNAASCLVTTFAYDPYGNPASTTASNCAAPSGRAVFLPRISSVTFGQLPSQGITTNGALAPNVTVNVPAGLVATLAQNALGHTENRQYDPRFGAITQVTGPNLLVTNAVIDDFGRKIKELRPDGTSTLTWYCIIGAGMDASSNTVIAGTPCPNPAAGEAPALAVRLVHTEVRDANGLKMAPFARQYLDNLGRLIRSSTESFDGANQPAGRSGAIVVSDVVYNAYGAKILETSPYFLQSGSPSTSGTNDVGATMHAYDELGRPIATYTADPDAVASHVQVFGGGGAVAYGVYGSRTASTTTYAYQGLSTTTTNDLGQARTEEKSARGDILRITDATGAQIAYLPDAFGNVVRTTDALQNSITSQYDYTGKKTQMNDPDKGVISYCFDPLGQVKAQQNSTMRGSHTPQACPEVNDVAVNAQGTVATAVAGWTTVAYDKLGRPTHRIEPEFESAWSYDQYANHSSCNQGIGKLCEVATTNGVDKKIFYDGVGREISNRTDISSGPSFATAVSFDSATGRLATKTYPTGLQIQYGYSGRGFLQALKLNTSATVSPLPNAQGQTATGTTLPAGTVLWQANAVNAKGVIEQDQLNNGVVDSTTYDSATGRIRAISATGPGGSALSYAYTWDGVNNLKARLDNNGDGINGAVTETFGFDALNRLSQYSVAAAAVPGYLRSVDLKYNALGMLLYKTDVGNYSYPTQGASAVTPHAVQSIAGASTTSYHQDLNGNVVNASDGKYRKMSYTSFDMVGSANDIVGSPLPTYTWLYDESHARMKEVRIAGGNTRTLWYLHPDNVGGLGFESEIDSAPASQSNRHFIGAEGRSVGVLVSTGPLPTLSAGQMGPIALGTIALNKVEFWHKDHLGSVSATTDHAGTVTQRYSYDPFGKRRFTDGRYDEQDQIEVDWKPDANYGTARGFTGHEGLDDIGLVNMNGRLYDSTAGIFVQADPSVTNPVNLQNYNRYGYVLNNPLNATDPSGFDPWGAEPAGGDQDPGWFSRAGTWLLNQLATLGNAAGGALSATGKSDGSGSNGGDGSGSKQDSGKEDPGTGGHERPHVAYECGRHAASTCGKIAVSPEVRERAAREGIMQATWPYQERFNRLNGMGANVPTPQARFEGLTDLLEEYKAALDKLGVPWRGDPLFSQISYQRNLQGMVLGEISGADFGRAAGHMAVVTGLGDFPGQGGNVGALKGATRWRLGPNDLDFRGTGRGLRDALNTAFERTGLPKEEFEVTKWARDANGKSFPVEWRHSSGAEVNIDRAHARNGPAVPHVGFQTGGKRGDGGAIRGHILLDDVPVFRQ